MTDKTELENHGETREAFYDSEGKITGYKTPNPKLAAEFIERVLEWSRKHDLEQLAGQGKEK